MKAGIILVFGLMLGWTSNGQEKVKSYRNFQLKNGTIVYEFVYKYNLAPATIKDKLGDIIRDNPNVYGFKNNNNGYVFSLNDVKVPINSSISRDSILIAFEHKLSANIDLQFLPTGGYLLRVSHMAFIKSINSPLDFLDNSMKRQTLESQVLNKYYDAFRIVDFRVKTSLEILDNDLWKLFLIQEKSP